MQTTPTDHILNLNERHTIHITSVLRESQTLNAKYTLIHISIPKVIGTNYNKNGQLNFVTATSYLNNLCVFLLFSIVTEDGQKVGRKVYLLN